jgi:hypothetical protein
MKNVKLLYTTIKLADKLYLFIICYPKYIKFLQTLKCVQGYKILLKN